MIKKGSPKVFNIQLVLHFNKVSFITNNNNNDTCLHLDVIVEHVKQNY